MFAKAAGQFGPVSLAGQPAETSETRGFFEWGIDPILGKNGRSYLPIVTGDNAKPTQLTKGNAMNTLTKMTAAIGLAIASAAVASVPANALGIRNCTSHVIKIQTFNNNDDKRIFPKQSKKIGPGDLRLFSGKRRITIKVFDARGFDKLKFVRGGLSANAKYSILRNWRIVKGEDCGRSSARPDKSSYIKTAAIRGRWVFKYGGRRYSAVLRPRGSNAFVMFERGVREKKLTYHRTGPRTFRDAYGRTLHFRSATLALHNDGNSRTVLRRKR